MKLAYHDLRMAVQRLPKKLRNLMENPIWYNSIFVGGGYIRSIIAGEYINDIDVFITDERHIDSIANALADNANDIYKTQNAITIRGKIPIQIITRWKFLKPEDVADSFDFTICCAVIYCNKKAESVDENNFQYNSYIDPSFYQDLAAKRLNYRNPIRNEDAGGSMLRVLKYYQRGYRIPLDCLADVITRLLQGVDWAITDPQDEAQVSKVICGLLREVDPNIDPTHAAHLPSSKDDEQTKREEISN